MACYEKVIKQIETNMSGGSIPIVLDIEKTIKIKKWKVKVGTLVSNGQILFTYDLAKSGSKKKELTFKSTSVGIVRKIIAKEGDSVSPGGVLLEVEDSEHDQYTDLLHREWRVFRVSPLYNFSFNKLKIYERILNKELNAIRKLTSTASYNCSFTANNKLKINNQHIDALQVKVTKDETQTVYMGHFIPLSNGHPKEDGSVSLPILLVQAKYDAMCTVHSAFTKLFDCDIQSVTFSLHALVSFFVKLLETPRSNFDVSHEQVAMEYAVPECAANDRIKVSLCLEDTTVVFAVVMDFLQEKHTEITPDEIIWEFYKDVLNHIHQVYNLNFVYAELKKVAFPDASLTSDGQLKMSTDDAANSALDVLKYFTSLDSVVGWHKRRLV